MFNDSTQLLISDHSGPVICRTDPLYFLPASGIRNRHASVRKGGDSLQAEGRQLCCERPEERELVFLAMTSKSWSSSCSNYTSWLQRTGNPETSEKSRKVWEDLDLLVLEAAGRQAGPPGSLLRSAAVLSCCSSPSFVDKRAACLSSLDMFAYAQLVAVMSLLLLSWGRLKPARKNSY